MNFAYIILCGKGSIFAHWVFVDGTNHGRIYTIRHKKEIKMDTTSLQAEIGRRIMLRRKDLRLSQKALAGLAKTSQKDVWKVENSKANYSLNLLNRIATALDLNLDIILQDSTGKDMRY